MLVALIVPLLAACGGDDDEETPAAATGTSATGGASPTTGSAGSTATTAATTTGGASPTAGAAATPTTATAATAASTSATSPTQATGGNRIPGGDPLMGKTIEEAENEGGTLIEGSPADLRTVNPIIVNDVPSSNFLALIFEGLVEENPDTLEPTGVLATEWEISEDNLTWTFYLREGVMWHDGEPFTANDVKFTYDLHMNPESTSSYTGDLTGKIASVDVVDDMTIAFTLTAPFADFAIDSAGYPIIAEHIWGDTPAADVATDSGSTGADPSRVVGTGPFKFQEWLQTDHATAVRNDDYWGGAPHLDEYIVRIFADQTAAMQSLKTGEIDWLSEIPGPNVPEFEGTDVEIITYPTLAFTFYGANLDIEKTPLFQDVVVRQAMMYALDREGINETVRGGYGEVAVGTMPTLSWAYNPEGIEEPLRYDFDPDLANQMLDEAGWTKNADGVREKDGLVLEFDMHYDSGDPQQTATAAIMQENWNAIGLAMTPIGEPFQQLVERIAGTFDYEVFLVGFFWGASPDQGPMFDCDSYAGGFNIVKYCNPEVDALLDEARAEPDQAKRIELYTEYQNTLLADIPMGVMIFPQGITGLNTRVHNVFANNVNERFNPETWWVEE